MNRPEELIKKSMKSRDRLKMYFLQHVEVL